MEKEKHKLNSQLYCNDIDMNKFSIIIEDINQKNENEKYQLSDFETYIGSLYIGEKRYLIKKDNLAFDTETQKDVYIEINSLEHVIVD